MRRRVLLAAWVIILWACLAALAAAPVHAGDGRLRWRTLETDHFVVTYYEPNDAVARRIALSAERAHRVLVPSLGHAPARKTQIVVLDTTDSANGFANAYGRPQITLFATAPEPGSVLSDVDDWYHLLVTHEYTHVVHLDMATGLPALYNAIFGKQWLPNSIQPRWFVEGLATYEESKRTSAGRVRSALFDMWLRARFLVDKDFRVDEIIHGPREYPHGNAAYLYGMSFLSYVADRYGDARMGEISRGYAENPIPFDVGRAFRAATGKNVEALWEEWRAHMRRRFALQVAAVERRGAIEGRALTLAGEENGSPHYSRDGKELLWRQSDGYSQARYRALRVDAEDTAPRDVAFLDAAGSFTPLDDGRLVVEQFRTFRAHYGFSDLVELDPATGRTRVLTRGARASDPDLSPDGKQVALAMNGSGRSRLALLARTPEAKPRVVWQGGSRFDQVSDPAWSPDGKSIAFSAWSQGGRRDVWLYDVATGRARQLASDRAMDLDPTWSPDGKWLLFASDRTGIYNIFALSPATGVLKQVTNVLGGAFSPDVSPDGKRLAYQGFGADGEILYELPLDEARWLDAEAYVDARPDPVTLVDSRDAAADAEGPAAIQDSVPYSPWSTLGPQIWNGQLTVDSFGQAFTVQTNGRDVAGWHSWNLGTTVGFTRGDVGFGGSYSYNRFWPSLNLSGGRGVSRPGGLVVDGKNLRYEEQSYGATASLGLPVLRTPEVSSDLSVSYDLDWLRNVDGLPPPDPSGPVTLPPETGVIAGIALSWSLQNVRRYAYTLGPQEGRSLGLSVRLNHPSLGSDFETLEVTYRWQEFWQMPWPGLHSIVAQLRGGIEEARRRRDGPYYLGGLGKQDILSSILNQTRTGSTGMLRGYEPGTIHGRQFHMASFEYRVPILDVNRGADLAPIYVRRLHAAALVDVGDAFDGPFEREDLRWAVGGALRLDVVFGYYSSGTFDLGYARGLSKEGLGQWWFLLTQSL